MQYPTIESTLGNTPLVRLQRLNEGLAPGVTVLCKMEGDNPAGSVKDRPAFYMVQGAQERGDIQPGDRLIEATSGNTIPSFWNRLDELERFLRQPDSLFLRQHENF